MSSAFACSGQGFTETVADAKLRRLREEAGCLTAYTPVPSVAGFFLRCNCVVDDKVSGVGLGKVPYAASAHVGHVGE